MGDILKSCVQKIKELPTLPATAHEVLSLTNDPLLSIDDLISIVESDPAISAKILNVANSAFFGYPVRTNQLNDAIMRIGVNNLKGIAVGIAILSFLGDSHKSPDYMRIYNHSISVGLTAQFIARSLRLNCANDIMVDGMLHDLGSLVLNRYFPDVYLTILDSMKQTNSLIDAEREILNYTHYDVGYWLAEKWKLPESILNSVLYHHTPSLARVNEERVSAVHISDYIVAKNIFSPIKDDPNYMLDSNAFDILSISNDDLKEMEDSVNSIPLSSEIFTMPHC